MPRWTLLLVATLALSPAAPERARSEAAAPREPVASVAFVPRFLVDDSGFVGRQATRPLARVEVFAERSEHLLGLRHGIYDLDCGAEVRLLRNLSLSGGYRLLDYELGADASEIDSETAGPFVALELRF